MNTLNLDTLMVQSTKEDVELVVLQTTAGEMGIMSGHIPTVAALKQAISKLDFTMVLNT